MNFPHSDITDPAQEGERMHALAAELFGWHRAITGEGLRRTLSRLAEELPLTLHEVPSGTPALDFTVPLEWEIRDAYVADARDQRVVDYRRSNLHVVSYSQPIRATLSWRKLEPHLHSLPDHPNWIPYRTAHFREEWGFCLPHRDRLELARRGPEQRYEVCIEAAHRPGSLTYGECFLPGETDEEVLLWTHACHPSLANDNLAGIVVAAALARHIARWPRHRYGYRFLFAPATIGALVWLSRNEGRLDRIKHGLVLAQLGDSGHLTYKRSRRHTAAIDHAMIAVLQQCTPGGEIRDFEPWGYDERQFCSPGIDLPIGRLTRSADGEYPEYHTSADNLELITPRALADSLDCCLRALRLVEENRYDADADSDPAASHPKRIHHGDSPLYVGTHLRGEPQLGRRGLYSGFGRNGIDPQLQRAVLWMLNLADGHHTLPDVARRSSMPIDLLREAAELLERGGLVSYQPSAISRQPSATDG